MPRMKSAPNSPDTTLESDAWLRKSPSGWLDRSKAREICQSANNVHGRRSTSDTTKKRKPMAKVENAQRHPWRRAARSEEHTPELQSLLSISDAVFCLKKKNQLT